MDSIRLRAPTGLLLLAFVPACAGAPPRAARAAEEPPSADRVLADVAWLADDAREGRRAGTPGELESARWIAQRLSALGLEPAGADAGWFDEFEVPLPPVDDGASCVVVDPAGAAERLGGERVAPLFCSGSGSARGRLVFAGHGIARPEKDWDDWAGLDVEGAVVLVLRGTPSVGSEAADDTTLVGRGGAGQEHDEDDPGWGGTGSLFYKVMEAKRRGAVAVLVANPPGREDELLGFDAGRAASTGVPALMVGREVAYRLVPGLADGGGAQPGAGAAVGEVEVVADVRRPRATARNVLARLSGRRRDRTVLLGAHFDHLGFGGVESLDPAARGQVHNGADDNASGTAAVLELARLFAREGPQEGDVVFALWSGEELGLLGSEHWIHEPTIDLAGLQANLNFDMVGRAGDGHLAVLGAGSCAEFPGWLAELGPAAGLELDVNDSGHGVGGSDHQTFLKQGIPVLHFFSGLHADYHRPSDDVESVEPGGVAKTVVLARGLIRRIQSERRLAFVPEPNADQERVSTGGFKVRFGSVPDYAWQGPGVRLSGTSPGSPAAAAGLREGDVLVGLGEVEIESIYDLVYALQFYDPGDAVVARYDREGAEQSVLVTLEASQPQ